MARTQVVLYRIGNAASPKMDKVRPKDIDIFDMHGEDWVRAGTGGISTSERRGRDQYLWCLDQGYDYGRLLLVWNDHGQHWSWEPSLDMLLADYAALLHATHRSFYRV